MVIKTIKSWFKGFKKNPSDSKSKNLQKNTKTDEGKKIILVGNPNVGKSLLFNRLTGSYVTVSNYPGTTVSVDTGKCEIAGEKFEVIDSPGMYSLSSITEEERISKLILFQEDADVLVHVVDAKNMERMLPLTLQLAEAKLPVILAVNMIDEAEKAGIKIDQFQLEKELKIPVVTTAATTGEGIAELHRKISEYTPQDNYQVNYDEKIETSIQKIKSLLEGDYPISKRSLSLLLLQEDEDVENLVKDTEGSNYENIHKVVSELISNFKQPVNYLVKMKLQREASNLISVHISDYVEEPMDFKEKISRAMIRPLTGVPILLVSLFALFIWLGVGADSVGHLIEDDLFDEFLTPIIIDWVNTNIPYTAIQDLIVGEFGIFTLGITYAIGIILPIVGFFFFAFSVLEDSGYLPRLALLLDRLFKKIGLSGRAIIPMVLGVGCGSMATLVTRTLETDREKKIATLLLALTIPCAAQLGVIFAVLSVYPSALILWGVVILLTYISIGFAASKLLPGANPSFYMELPPIRFPKLSNVLRKTYTRLIWYFKELFPLFIAISILIWALDLVGALDFIIGGMNPLLNALGLPIETAQTFILGFFRRDYGAAGLYNIQEALTGVQLLVTAVVLTLFMPCVVQFVVMMKERGTKIGILMALFVVVFAFMVGFLLNFILTGLGVVL